jgi:glutamate synthase (NADPH) small chain
MPGSQREVTNAEEEGVEFRWLSAPASVTVKRGGAVKGVKVTEMRLGPPDPSGRRSPEPTGKPPEEIKADMVIKALGFDPEDLPGRFNEQALSVNRWGGVKVDLRTMMTSMDGVFAAGDIVRGASLVVWAIREGRDAAMAMDTWLKARASVTRMRAAE